MKGKIGIEEHFAIDETIQDSSPRFPGDSVYRSGDAERRLKENGFISQVHRRGKRGKPLSRHKSQVNTRRSRVRARVEHVLAFQESAMGGKLVRTIGIAGPEPGSE